MTAAGLRATTAKSMAMTPVFVDVNGERYPVIDCRLESSADEKSVELLVLKTGRPPKSIGPSPASGSD